MKGNIVSIVLIIIVFLTVLFFMSRSSGQGQEALNLSVASTASEPSVISAAPGTNVASHQSAAASSVPADDPLTALRAIPEARTFVSLLDTTGVTAELSSTGTYTFFVPTNAAFAASPLGPLSAMSDAQKKRLAEFHIVSGKMMSVDAIKSGHMTMLSRDDLNANVFDSAQVSGNSHVVATYHAQNGIIYLIDIVLQPPIVRPYPF